MARWIDADAMLDRIPNLYERRAVARWTDEAPAADVAPVRHGGWVYDGFDIPHGVDWMHCSICNRREPHVPAAMTPYCPNCGAKMDERGEDE